MDIIAVIEKYIEFSVRRDNLKNTIENSKNNYNYSKIKGDIAFANHNFQEEQEYNRISSDCYLEIEKIKPTLYYYEKFVNDLNYRDNKNVDNDFGPTGPVKQ